MTYKYDLTFYIYRGSDDVYYFDGDVFEDIQHSMNSCDYFLVKKVSITLLECVNIMKTDTMETVHNNEFRVHLTVR